jgi:hypothetical protein
MPGSAFSIITATDNITRVPMSTPYSDGNSNPVVMHQSASAVGGVSTPTSNSNPLPVAVVSGNGNKLTYQAPQVATVAPSSTSIVTAGAFVSLIVLHLSSPANATVWLNPSGGAAVVGQGIPLIAGAPPVTFGTPSLPLPTAAITAISEGVSQNVSIVGA